MLVRLAGGCQLVTPVIRSENSSAARRAIVKTFSFQCPMIRCARNRSDGLNNFGVLGRMALSSIVGALKEFTAVRRSLQYRSRLNYSRRGLVVPLAHWPYLAPHDLLRKRPSLISLPPVI